MMWKSISGLAESSFGGDHPVSNIYLYIHTHTHSCRDMYLKYDMCFILSMFFHFYMIMYISIVHNISSYVPNSIYEYLF